MTNSPVAAEAPGPSPFVDGIRLGYVAQLAPHDSGAFLSTEELLLDIQGERVSIQPALLEGLHSRYSVFPRVVGSMPLAAWALELSHADRTSRLVLSRWGGNEWQNADSLLKGMNLVAISSWSGGRTLALVDDDSDESAAKLAFTQVGGARGAALPQFRYTKQNGNGCVHGISPTTMRALPSGEVFLTGSLCDTTEADGVHYHGVAILRWDAGKTQSTATVLPHLSEAEIESATLDEIVATTGNDVIVAGSRVANRSDGEETKSEAYLAHFDGHAWRALPAPPIDRIEVLQRSPDGKLWALSHGQLWATQGGALDAAVWAQVPAPAFTAASKDQDVTSLWVRGNDDVWATVGSEDSSFLVRTNLSERPLSAPTAEQVAELSRGLDADVGESCEHQTLVLLTLSRNAPADADFPSVRRALAGHAEFSGKTQFIELPFLTRRYLGVRGDDAALVELQDLLVRSNLAGIRPELRCFNAAPTRTLTMDFRGTKPPLGPPLPRTTKLSHSLATRNGRSLRPLD
ncbi:MAG: hypothetical protein ABJB12_16240 [Pseudomonadota bacterium]